MGQDPDAIRQEIEETRARMSETVDAIGYRADVPSRTKEKVSDKVENVKSKITGTAQSAKESVLGAKDSVADSAGSAREGVADKAGGMRETVAGKAGAINEATPGREDIKQGARQAVGMAQNNPLGLAIGATAVGFLAGLLAPSTRIENEKLGPMADQVKDTIRETGQEALEHGKAVASEVASQAKDTAQSSVQEIKDTAQSAAAEHGQELKDSAQESAQQAAPTGGSGSSESAAASGRITGTPTSPTTGTPI